MAEITEIRAAAQRLRHRSQRLLPRLSMDSLIPNGFLSALTEVSARMAEIATEGRGVGVISLYAQPDAALYRLPLEHLRTLAAC